MIRAMKYFNQVLYSDINPFEVIRTVSEKTFLIKSMKSTLKNLDEIRKTFVPGGFIGHVDNSIQEWNIEKDADGSEIKIRLHKDGTFRDSSGIKYSPSDTPMKVRDFNF